MAPGTAIWLTGLPSSGKTTLAESLALSLKQHGAPVEVLDGDEIRRSISVDLGFSAKDRQEHARRVIFLSKLLARNGVNVVVPLISTYRETTELARQELERFVEVYVKCPLEECIRRDVKGLYARAIRGEITEFTGISDPYEPPDSPEVTVETDILSEDECCQLILAAVPELAPQGYSNNGLMTKSVPGQ
ncbi:MAG TPA: adenylyl-sulfate kinase [Dehalococcoidia bacterium]|nr:adenylyl-sulfate kinase [Dehalococcoidia bacterium]